MALTTSGGGFDALRTQFMQNMKIQTCLPFLVGTFLFANSVYLINTDNAFLNFFYFPLIASSFIMNYIGGQTLAMKNIHSQF